MYSYGAGSATTQQPPKWSLSPGYGIALLLSHQVVFINKIRFSLLINQSALILTNSGSQSSKSNSLPLQHCQSLLIIFHLIIIYSSAVEAHFSSDQYLHVHYSSHCDYEHYDTSQVQLVERPSQSTTKWVTFQFIKCSLLNNFAHLSYVCHLDRTGQRRFCL